VLADGLIAIFELINVWKVSYPIVLAGGTLQHGQPEPWKLNAAKYGRTKKSRQSTVKSDGAAPTKTKELIATPGRPKGSANIFKLQEMTYASYGTKDSCRSLDLCWLEIVFQIYEEMGLHLTPRPVTDIPCVVMEAFNELSKRKMAQNPRAFKGRLTRTITWVKKSEADLFVKILDYAEPFDTIRTTKSVHRSDGSKQLIMLEDAVLIKVSDDDVSPRGIDVAIAVIQSS
jgi:hypothetical protein